MKNEILKKIIETSEDELTKEDLKNMLFESEEELLSRLFQILDYFIEEYNR